MGWEIQDLQKWFFGCSEIVSGDGLNISSIKIGRLTREMDLGVFEIGIPDVGIE